MTFVERKSRRVMQWFYSTICLFTSIRFTLFLFFFVAVSWSFYERTVPNEAPFLILDRNSSSREDMRLLWQIKLLGRCGALDETVKVARVGLQSVSALESKTLEKTNLIDVDLISVDLVCYKVHPELVRLRDRVFGVRDVLIGFANDRNDIVSSSDLIDLV